MRRLSSFNTLSADGRYADPDGGLNGLEPHEEGHRFANHLIDTAGDLVKLTGSRTFPNGGVMLEYVPDRREEASR
jgi:hypothetical protein